MVVTSSISNFFVQMWQKMVFIWWIMIGLVGCQSQLQMVESRPSVTIRQSPTPPPAITAVSTPPVFPITIYADGLMIHTTTHTGSITAVLAQSNIALTGDDYTRPSQETILRPGDSLQVVRVSYDYKIVDTPTPFQTIWQATDQLEIDQQAIIEPGHTGITRARWRVRYENGVEVGQTLDTEWVERQPVNQVVGYGTHIVLRVVDTPSGPREYWRVVKMRVTSYTAASSGKEPDDPGYGYTASGYGVAQGIVAVDRSIVPFGSYVYVPGYGVGYVGDTGGGVRGRWIDLGYSETDFIPWSGYIDVYYLAPAPSPEDINFLLPAELP